MTEKNHSNPRVVDWTLGNSAEPNESILVTLGWLLGPITICAVIGYLLWV